MSFVARWFSHYICHSVCVCVSWMKAHECFQLLVEKEKGKHQTGRSTYRRRDRQTNKEINVCTKHENGEPGENTQAITVTTTYCNYFWQRIACDHAGQYPYLLLFRKLTSVLPLCVGSQAAGSRTEQVWKRNVLKTCRAVQVNHAIWQCRVITTCCFFLWILICFVLFQGFRHSMKVRFCCVNTCGPRKYWIQICWKTKAGGISTMNEIP